MAGEVQDSLLSLCAAHARATTLGANIGRVEMPPW
jgi:hypothetical protein